MQKEDEFICAFCGFFMRLAVKNDLTVTGFQNKQSFCDTCVNQITSDADLPHGLNPATIPNYPILGVRKTDHQIIQFDDVQKLREAACTGIIKAMCILKDSLPDPMLEECIRLSKGNTLEEATEIARLHIQDLEIAGQDIRRRPLIVVWRSEGTYRFNKTKEFTPATAEEFAKGLVTHDKDLLFDKPFIVTGSTRGLPRTALEAFLYLDKSDKAEWYDNTLEMERHLAQIDSLSELTDVTWEASPEFLEACHRNIKEAQKYHKRALEKLDTDTDEILHEIKRAKGEDWKETDETI